jgi:hypothetical protein
MAGKRRASVGSKPPLSIQVIAIGAHFLRNSTQASCHESFTSEIHFSGIKPNQTKSSLVKASRVIFSPMATAKMAPSKHKSAPRLNLSSPWAFH